jgi:penicillin-binding protein 2
VIRDQDRYRTFSRRAVLLAGGKLALFSALAGRMYYLQVVEAERYRTLAEDNRINMRLLAPLRGAILDRGGVEIATNRQNYRLILVPERSPDIEETLLRVARFIELEEADHNRVKKEVRRKRGFVPVTLRENLDWEEVAKIEVHTPDLPGVLIEVGQTRLYPFADSAAHLVGYVGAVSESEQTGDPLLELPSFRVGKNGVEKVFDEKLRGRGGRSEVEVNATGRVIRELSRREGRTGDPVRLTIDIGLQDFAHARLGSESAAVTVMEVESGDVLALASAPAFDPNAFNEGISLAYWRELNANERAPLTNKAIAGQYAPGSTFKVVVALAALESGAVDAAHQVFCRGHVQLGKARFHCWKKWGHGTLDMVGALQQSCDVYFYDLARRLGVNRIGAMAEKLGLGKSAGIGLPGEKPGLVPTREWKLAVMGKRWQGGETLVTGIGQGFVLATPLQLAVMTARIANGGRAVEPRIFTPALAGPDGVPPAAPSWPGLGISESALDTVRQGMFAVTNTRRGTAYRSRIEEEAWRMAGKTGASQVRRITLSERRGGVIKNEKLPWKERDHALFVAYAPAHAPRYAASVVVEHGGGGSKAAAPIARDILRETFIRAEKAARAKAREAKAPGTPGGFASFAGEGPPGGRKGGRR